MGNKPGGLAAKLAGRSAEKVERDSLSSANKKDKGTVVQPIAGKNGESARGDPSRSLPHHSSLHVTLIRCPPSLTKAQI